MIAVVAGSLPFALGISGLGRPRMVVGVGGVLAIAWIFALATKRSDATAVPLWFVGGLVILLYAIWCGGLWLGVRIRRIRHATPG